MYVPDIDVSKSPVILINDEISPGDYATQMVEVVENLIVKVGRSLPIDRQIPGETITEWKNSMASRAKLYVWVVVKPFVSKSARKYNHIVFFATVPEKFLGIDKN